MVIIFEISCTYKCTNPCRRFVLLLHYPITIFSSDETSMIACEWNFPHISLLCCAGGVGDRNHQQISPETLWEPGLCQGQAAVQILFKWSGRSPAQVVATLRSPVTFWTDPQFLCPPVPVSKWVRRIGLQRATKGWQPHEKRAKCNRVLCTFLCTREVIAKNPKK